MPHNKGVPYKLCLHCIFSHLALCNLRMCFVFFWLVVLVKLEDAEFRVLESAGFASVCCELGGATGKVISINITSSSGTAQG